MATRTRQAIDQLKDNWLGDPGCYDIETVEGFEDHYDELLAWRRETEARWEQERTEKLSTLAEAIGCPGNLKLAAYVERLERRITSLEAVRD